MIVDHLTVRETVFIDANQTRRTRDGYLVANARVARTGIQLYAGRELGHSDKEVIRVYRPEGEVFDKAAMGSIAHRPITNDHPHEPVTADNWRKYAVGQVDGEVARDGDFIRVPMVVMDGPTIRDVEDGKRELSLGYSADLVWQPGMTDKGEAYDAIQTNIRVNHLAIVDAARGGPKLKIGDAREEGWNGPPRRPQTGEEPMTTDAKQLKTITVDGISCEMSDVAAQVVQKRVADLESSVRDRDDRITALQTDAVKAKEAADAAAAEAKKQIETKDAEIATLKKQVEDAKVTPAKLDEMVKTRDAIAKKAAAVLGKDADLKDKTDVEIRRMVVDKKLGEAAKGWNDDQVKASFDTLTADIKTDGATNDASSAMARAFSGPPQTQDAALDKSRKAYLDRISNGWKHAAE